MFSSEVTAPELIGQIRTEADIVITITDESYVQWINSVEQLLYTEIIREQKTETISIPDTASPIAITNIVPGVAEQQPIFEDIYKVYADDCELLYTSMTGGVSHPRIGRYWKDGTDIAYKTRSGAAAEELTIIYYVRPKLKTKTSTEKIAVPPEFIGLVSARLRGEAYKIANEDTLAAKWLNDYNSEVENFKLWMASKVNKYGE